jgi:type 1 fimbria pilin
MNKKLTILGTALLLGAATSAFAASSTDLTVTGTITPAACTPSLAGGGVVDFGTIAAKDLKPDASTRLEPKTLQLTVNCDAETLFAIKPVDNRAESSTNPVRYGLGFINGDEKLGEYVLNFSNVIADTPSVVLESSDGGVSWTDGSNAIYPGYLVAFGDDTGIRVPHPLQDVSVDMRITPFIAPTQNLTLTDEVQIDGSATLQIVYL